MNKEYKYQTSIDVIKLGAFEDAIVDGNLSALVISGFPPEAELQEAFQQLLTQYVDRIGSDEYKIYLQLYKELGVLRITVKQIDAIVAREDKEKGIEPGILRLTYDQYFHSEIEKLLHTKVNLNPENPEEYEKELDKLYKRKSGVNIRLQLKEMQFEAIKKAKEDSNQKETFVVTRAYFTSMLVTMSEQYGLLLNKDITVGTYCEMLNRMAKKSKESSTKSKKNFYGS